MKNIDTKILFQYLDKQLMTVDDAILSAFVDVLQRKFSTSLRAVMFYGSCLRSREYKEAMLDFYVIVDDYQTAYDSKAHAVLNACLAPNVYFQTVEVEDLKVQAKYAVLSEKDLLLQTSTRAYHSYFWARFAQPFALIYQADVQARVQLIQAQINSITTIYTKTIGLFNAAPTAREFWVGALQKTYSAELRAESKLRAGMIYESNQRHYDEAFNTLMNMGFNYSSRTSRWTVWNWVIRAAWGKLLSILRLLKAATTFENGVDYLAWKIERHSGVHVEINDRHRKHPFIYCWPILWRLWRKGAVQ